LIGIDNLPSELQQKLSEIKEKDIELIGIYYNKKLHFSYFIIYNFSIF